MSSVSLTSTFGGLAVGGTGATGGVTGVTGVGLSPPNTMQLQPAQCLQPGQAMYRVIPYSAPGNVVVGPPMLGPGAPLSPAHSVYMSPAARLSPVKPVSPVSPLGAGSPGLVSSVSPVAMGSAIRAAPQPYFAPAPQRSLVTPAQPSLLAQPQVQPYFVTPPQPQLQPHFVTSPQPHFLTPSQPALPQPHLLTQPQPHLLTQPQPHLLTPTQPHLLTQPQPHLLTQPQPHLLTPTQPHLLTPAQPHLLTQPQPQLMQVQPLVVAAPGRPQTILAPGVAPQQFQYSTPHQVVNMPVQAPHPTVLSPLAVHQGLPVMQPSVGSRVFL